MKRLFCKRMLCIISVALMTVFVFAPNNSKADGAYEKLKMLMEMKIVSDVSVPDYQDITTLVKETEGETMCLIHLIDRYIIIDGRDKNNKFESLCYRNLSNKQLLLYAISICTMYESIDDSKTTAKEFSIGLYYDDNEDPLIIINAETAKEVSEILSNIAKSQ